LSKKENLLEEMKKMVISYSIFYCFVILLLYHLAYTFVAWPLITFFLKFSNMQLFNACGAGTDSYKICAAADDKK